MLRTIAISLILVLSVGIMMPFTNSAHGVRQSTQIGKKRHHRYRSRAWWRRYRARMRQKRLAAELAHRKALLQPPTNITVGNLSGLSGPALPSLPTTSATTTTLPPPEMVANVTNAVSNGAPNVVSQASNSETRPRVVNSNHPAFRASASAPAPPPLPPLNRARGERTRPFS